MAGAAGISGSSMTEILEKANTQSLGPVSLTESNFKFEIVNRPEDFRESFHVSASDYILDNAIIDNQLILLPNSQKDTVEKLRSNHVIRHNHSMKAANQAEGLSLDENETGREISSVPVELGSRLRPVSRLSVDGFVSVPEVSVSKKGDGSVKVQSLGESKSVDTTMQERISGDIQSISAVTRNGETQTLKVRPHLIVENHGEMPSKVIKS